MGHSLGYLKVDLISGSSCLSSEASRLKHWAIYCLGMVTTENIGMQN